MRYAYWLLVVMNFNVVLCNGWSDVCGALVLLLHMWSWGIISRSLSDLSDHAAPARFV